MFFFWEPGCTAQNSHKKILVKLFHCNLGKVLVD
jgi:hypothetical protein